MIFILYCFNIILWTIKADLLFYRPNTSFSKLLFLTTPSHYLYSILIFTMKQKWLLAIGLYSKTNRKIRLLLLVWVHWSIPKWLNRYFFKWRRLSATFFLFPTSWGNTQQHCSVCLFWPDDDKFFLSVHS
jgi:hypothetical protein